jgi:hypothetical protein
MSGGKILEQIEIGLRNIETKEVRTVYIDVFDNSLSRKWLVAFNHLIINNFHLEKNFCFLGFTDTLRDGKFILDQVNKSISAINQSNIGYQINDYFSLENTLSDKPTDERIVGRQLIHDKFNRLHRYFEDLQGASGNMSPFATAATPNIKWHIRQLNLLCHEYESWALSYRKELDAPDWKRLSQLMCWLNAPRFMFDENDYELFGIETLNRPLGGVFVGVNKAVGKHHWEVFNDEGRDSKITQLTTSTLRSQTEAAGDFDIEWGRNPGEFDFQKRKLSEFRHWLINNGFDPDDKALTIGHPQVGQVDLMKSFGTTEHQQIWDDIATHLDVYSIKTRDAYAEYDYHWSDTNFISNQITIIEKGR